MIYEASKIQINNSITVFMIIGKLKKRAKSFDQKWLLKRLIKF